MAFRTNLMPTLQEKSASGSVATFNTALAMPLASCNIAVNAWQEGSGDPSPSNVRAIHGFSEVNATKAGKNLLPTVFPDNVITANLAATITSASYAKVFALPCKPNTNYVASHKTKSTWNIAFSNKLPEIGDSVDYKGAMTNRDSFLVNSGNNKYLLIGVSNASVFDNFSENECQIEVGSTATAYEPYVTPTIYTIQLGEEVYGAEVDIVNGVAHITHPIVDLSSQNWGSYGTNRFYFSLPSTARAKSTNLTSLCSCYKREPNNSDSSSMADLSFCVKVGYVVIRDDSFNNDVTAFVNSLTGQKLIYELATLIDIQLTPTQIETLIGNNSFASDSGDISLTFKDLDIAKRGSFREVFKLPS